MNVAEEIERLQTLHLEGALTDEEFSNAKAAVIARQKTNPAQITLPECSQPTQSVKVRPRFVVVSLLFLAAFFTNPDQSSLEKTCRENTKKNAGTLENLAATALVGTSFERKNYYLFSVGTIKTRVRLVGEQHDIEVFGAFGNWWFDLAHIPFAYSLSESHASLSWMIYIVVVWIILAMSEVVVFDIIELIKGPAKNSDKTIGGGTAQQADAADRNGQGGVGSEIPSQTPAHSGG